MTLQELLRILQEFDFSAVEKDKGIYEICEENDVVLGVSFENLGQADMYIYNLFYKGEYVNIYGEYLDPLDINAFKEIVTTWTSL